MVAVSRPALTWVEGTDVAVRATSFCKLMDAVVGLYALVSVVGGNCHKRKVCCLSSSYISSNSTTWNQHSDLTHCHTHSYL